MNKDLGKRMKEYEYISRNYLMMKNPVIIRLDGKAFHTFTKGLEKPFDKILIETMWETAKYLCDNIQGCKVAYTQSDEISLLLVNYENENSCAWFDNNIQKMASVSASMATLAFNKNFIEIFNKHNDLGIIGKEKVEKYEKKFFSAIFDSRVFLMPKEEVNNYFVWRQQDAVRNSIQMVGRANFSHKMLDNKSCKDIKEMLNEEKGINFDLIPIYEQRGACIYKETYYKDISDNPAIMLYNKEATSILRKRWAVDKDIPLFVEDNEYINKHI